MGGVMATLRRRGAADQPSGELEQPLLGGTGRQAEDGAAITPLLGQPQEGRWPLHLGALARALAAAWQYLLGAAVLLREGLCMGPVQLGLAYRSSAELGDGCVCLLPHWRQLLQACCTACCRAAAASSRHRSSCLRWRQNGSPSCAAEQLCPTMQTQRSTRQEGSAGAQQTLCTAIQVQQTLCTAMQVQQTLH